MSSLTYSAHRDAMAAGRFVRVVNYHNTPRAAVHHLRAELGLYAQEYASITLAELDGFFATGSWASARPGFIPVFYEGFRTAHDVAAPVCDELGLTGWFPVCTGFVDCPVAEQEAYARSHWIELVPEDLSGERIAMDWDEVGSLAARHVVFPHTASHAGIADVATEEDLHREVAEPKERLEAATGVPAAAFVWLWGSPWGVSARHDAALRAAGYRYLFSNTMVHRIA